MGAVYIAEHLSLRKQVAFKVIRPEFAGNEEIAARFTREAMATAQLDHPNVASALDYGTLPDGGAYLVTQLVRGRSLEHHRSAGKMPWRQVCDLGAQIADALGAAHAIHIVHRDLKPDNLLLEPRDDGTFLVKVLDFGVARITAGAPPPGGDLTRLGAVIGTPGYMAPEQAMGESVDFRVDLYALGVILWECSTGRILWSGETISDVFTRQLAGPAPPLAAELPELPPEFSAMIDLLLSRSPRRRPESARQVRDALRRMAHGTLAFTPMVPKARPPRAPSPLGAADRRSRRADRDGRAARPRARPRARRGRGRGPRGSSTLLPRAGLMRQVRRDRFRATTEPRAVPAALAAEIEALMTSADRRARKRAGEAVLAHEPQDAVPLYARNVAWLGKASSCDGKKAALKKIAEAGDARALPALQRLARTPRKGCGVFDSRDCLECLRETLAKTIAQFELK
jgi:tRNA A-37 threonylcarbamoyl transferase component Bud32